MKTETSKILLEIKTFVFDKTWKQIFVFDTNFENKTVLETERLQDYKRGKITRVFRERAILDLSFEPKTLENLEH